MYLLALRLVYGDALGNLLSADTMETMIEVEVEEDCTNTVTRMPIMRPTMGFLMYLLLMMSPATRKVITGLTERM